MGKVERIENEVRALSSEELSAFRKWFREFDANAWDREIEADALAGKLDVLADSTLLDRGSRSMGSLNERGRLEPE